MGSIKRLYDLANDSNEKTCDDIDREELLHISLELYSKIKFIEKCDRKAIINILDILSENDYGRG